MLPKRSRNLFAAIPNIYSARLAFSAGYQVLSPRSSRLPNRSGARATRSKRRLIKIFRICLSATGLIRIIVNIMYIKYIIQETKYRLVSLELRMKNFALFLMHLRAPSTESTLSEVEWAQDMLCASVANSRFKKQTQFIRNDSPDRFDQVR